MEKIDNNTTKILSFIYKYDSVSIQNIINKFDLSDNLSEQYITSLLQFLITEGYMGLIVDADHYVLKYNLSDYLNQCTASNTNPLSPTMSVYLLPPGRALVEISRRNRWYFFAPFVVSAVSVLISLLTLLHELLDKSPTLVRLVLK